LIISVLLEIKGVFGSAYLKVLMTYLLPGEADKEFFKKPKHFDFLENEIS